MIRWRKQQHQIDGILLDESQHSNESASSHISEDSLLSEAPNSGPSFYAETTDGESREAAQVSKPAACSAGCVTTDKRQEEDPDSNDDDVLQLAISEDEMDF